MWSAMRKWVGAAAVLLALVGCAQTPEQRVEFAKYEIACIEAGGEFHEVLTRADEWDAYCEFKYPARWEG